MKLFRYLFIGIIFGITLAKAEIVSWYRIYEMFRFQSFHMYGVIGSAVVIGIIFVQIIKRTRMKSIDGEPITINPKQFSVPRYLLGGIIFGLGWAMTGACPGPMFILVGNGVSVIVVVILSALLDTYVYGLLRKKLPH
ncbi:MAG: YeeE/YedE family protein [Ekhidna sp.]|nr:YeeE/YedE family protein [Ekhidna sp.]